MSGCGFTCGEDIKVETLPIHTFNEEAYKLQPIKPPPPKDLILTLKDIKKLNPSK